LTTVAGEPIDVWCMDLDTLAAQRGRDLGTYLSADERERARRLQTARAKRRYTAGREMLRMALTRRSDLDPADVVFDYDSCGKPSTHAGGFFSVAHSDWLGVVAITQLGAVGIDIERIRASVDVDRIATRIFPADEVRRLATLPDGDRRRAFFERWVHAEAVTKAFGAGLLPSWSSRSLAIGDPGGFGDETRQDFTIARFSPAPKFTGCVAVRGCHQMTVRLHMLTELEPVGSR
jgi:4'-phosphopantetheinyl transferase